jgi:hypothetical protein
MKPKSIGGPADWTKMLGVETMSLNRYAARRDANDNEIARAAEKLGWFLIQSKEPCDYWGCLKCRCLWAPVEIKTTTGRLTDNQRSFKAQCELFGMPYLVWRSIDDVITSTNILRLRT